MRSGGSTLVGLPACRLCECCCCCRQTARRCFASSVAGPLAHRAVQHLRTPPLAPGLGCRGGFAASMTAAWRANAGHRASGACPLNGVRQATGEDMFHLDSQELAIAQICPVACKRGPAPDVWDVLGTYKRSPVGVEALARDTEGLILAKQTPMVRRGCGGIGLRVPERWLLLVRRRLCER